MGMEINAALSAGHTLKLIHQRLCQDGVEIAHSTLARYINRVRCERARQTARAGTFSGYQGHRPLKIQTPAAVREDQLASAMRALSKPSYNIREAMCDRDPTKKS